MEETKIFISGSISIKTLPEKVIDTLNTIIREEFKILVGDANGVDELVCRYCYKERKYKNICVYHIGNEPRQEINKSFETIKVELPDELQNSKKEKERQTVKDKKMAEDCDYAFIIWDGKSSGSYKNCEECFIHNKKIKVYLILEDKFIIINNSNDLEKIREIYRKNKGYTKKEVEDKLKEEGISFEKNGFNNFLIKYGIMEKEGVETKSKYKPTYKYKEFFIEKRSQGKFISYNFTDDLISIIKELYINTSIPKQQTFI